MSYLGKALTTPASYLPAQVSTECMSVCVGVGVCRCVWVSVCVGVCEEVEVACLPATAFHMR